MLYLMKKIKIGPTSRVKKGFFDTNYYTMPIFKELSHFYYVAFNTKIYISSIHAGDDCEDMDVYFLLIESTDFWFDVFS